MGVDKCLAMHFGSLFVAWGKTVQLQFVSEVTICVPLAGG